MIQIPCGTQIQIQKRCSYLTVTQKFCLCRSLKHISLKLYQPRSIINNAPQPKDSIRGALLSSLSVTMTTFTALSSSDENFPSISFDHRNVIADINPLTYGGFTEYVVSHSYNTRSRIECTDITSDTWADAYMAASTTPPIPMASLIPLASVRM
jgi:hypothetical protein